MKILTEPVGMLGTNCYILCDETTKRCVVVDPGGDGDRLIRDIQDSGCTLSAIFLTHGHFDHTQAVPELLAFSQVPVYIHRDEVSNESANGATGMMDLAFNPSEAKGLRHYDEGDELNFGGELRFKVLHTPGHSPGSVVLLMDGVLLTGDTLFHASCGRTDFPGGSYPQMLKSLRRLRDLPGDYQVLPGHEAPSTLEWERKNNYYVRLSGEQA